MTEPLVVLSLGAGVQSSTLALMAAHGEIGPMPDYALFADTGAEPPSVYKWLDWLAYHEGRERDLRAHLGKDVAVLKESVKGKTRPLTLQSFRERLERQETIDLTDEGGCGCFTP